jgi:hypothetical protein
VTNRAAPALRATALAGAILVASGCAAFSPVQTDELYLPADGVPLSTADVQFRNLALISSKAGADAVVVGQAVNSGTSAVQVAFAVAGGGARGTATVPASSGNTISDATTKVVIPAVAAGPGQVADLVVTTSGSGQNVVTVPVLLNSGPYASLTASGSASASPSASSSASSSPSPSASGSGSPSPSTSPSSSASPTPSASASS